MKNRLFLIPRISWIYFLSISLLQSEGVPLLNPVLAADPPHPPETTLPIQGGRLLIQIPAHFQAIKANHMELAYAWRIHSRTLFEAAFARGYVVTDLLFEDGQSCYALVKK